jgi:hypothetical protein
MVFEVLTKRVLDFVQGEIQITIQVIVGLPLKLFEPFAPVLIHGDHLPGTTALDDHVHSTPEA